MLTTIRKSGNSFIITVPREEMQRVGVTVGEHVLVEIRPVDVRPRLSADLVEGIEARLRQPEIAEAIDLLANA
jgi:antitoxin component of MazEF toxin-antitoxin module